MLEPAVDLVEDESLAGPKLGCAAPVTLVLGKTDRLGLVVVAEVFQNLDLE